MKDAVSGFADGDRIPTLLEMSAKQAPPRALARFVNSYSHRQKGNWINAILGDRRGGRDLGKVDSLLGGRRSNLGKFQRIQLALGHIPEPIVKLKFLVAVHWLPSFSSSGD
jgi:hypothetical protein